MNTTDNHKLATTSVSGQKLYNICHGLLCELKKIYLNFVYIHSALNPMIAIESLCSILDSQSIFCFESNFTKNLTFTKIE